MATTYTTNVRLQKPAAADRHWDLPLNANADYLDGLAAVGGLALAPAESPSVTTSCLVTSGTYIRADGTLFTFDGISSFVLPPSSISCVWIDDLGTVGSGPSFPTANHLRLGRVRTGPASVAQVIDARVAYQSSGANAIFVAKTGDTVEGPFRVSPPLGGVPTLSVDPTAGLVGFFGAAGATQAPRLNPLVDATGGTTLDTLADVGASFSQTTLNNNFASISAKIDALIAALKRHGLMSS